MDQITGEQRGGDQRRGNHADGEVALKPARRFRV
jgi:hypothetical protein